MIKQSTNFKPLLMAIENNNVQTFEHLFKHKHPLLLYYCKRLPLKNETIKDSLQSFFLSFWGDRTPISPNILSQFIESARYGLNI